MRYEREAAAAASLADLRAELVEAKAELEKVKAELVEAKAKLEKVKGANARLAAELFELRDVLDPDPSEWTVHDWMIEAGLDDEDAE